MKERAFAKNNLYLDVVRRREDGYHDLRMIMIPIDFMTYWNWCRLKQRCR